MHDSFLFPEFPSSFEKPLTAKLVNYYDERVLLLFGPSKVGKTRIANSEAALIASEINAESPPLVEVYLLESNQRARLISDLISIYALYNVPVNFYAFQSTYYLYKHLNALRKAINDYKLKREQTMELPRVLVIDSLSAIITELEINQQLGVRGEGAQPILARVSSMIESIVNLASYLVSEENLNGVALLVAHSTTTWTEKPYPKLSWLNEKVRYLTKGDYATDAHIYVTNTAKGKELCNKDNTQALVLAMARNTPTKQIGKKVCFKLKELKEKRKGVITIQNEKHYTVYMYRPAENGEEMDIHPVVPIPIDYCGEDGC